MAHSSTPASLSWIGRRNGEIRQAVRVAAGAVLAFVLANLLGFAHGYWAVITAIIVMQGNVGSSVKASVDRLIGTIVGGIYGALVAIFVPHAARWELAAALALAITPTAFLAALKPHFKVAPVTAFIVLLPLTGTEPPLNFAFDRILEITIGSLVGVAVSLLLLPSRAHQQMSTSAAKTIDLNADLLSAIIDNLLAGAGRPNLQGTHAMIRAALKKLENAAEEALRERRSHLTDLPDPEPMVRTLYRVRHDLVMVGRATARPFPSVVLPSLQAQLIDLRNALLEFLRGGATALREHKASPSLAPTETALKTYGLAMDALWSNETIRALAAEEAGRIFALRFALEQLGQDLRDLSNRISELARPGIGPAA